MKYTLPLLLLLTAVLLAADKEPRKARTFTRNAVTIAEVCPKGAEKEMILSDKPETIVLTHGGVIEIRYNEAKATLIITGKNIGTTLLIIRTKDGHTIQALYQVTKTDKDTEFFNQRFSEIEQTLNRE